jgi:hypothetical protein
MYHLRRPYNNPYAPYWNPYYSSYDTWLRGGTFAGTGMGGCYSVDPRSAPAYSNIYRLATAGALQRVQQKNPLGDVNFSSLSGVYLVALAIPVVVLSALFLTGVIKVD